MTDNMPRHKQTWSKAPGELINKVGDVSLARDMPTGHPLHPCQILSNYLKQYGSYGLHKISASGEITA